jgi:hypothetical protein
VGYSGSDRQMQGDSGRVLRMHELQASSVASVEHVDQFGYTRDSDFVYCFFCIEERL